MTITLPPYLVAIVGLLMLFGIVHLGTWIARLIASFDDAEKQLGRQIDRDLISPEERAH